MLAHRAALPRICSIQNHQPLLASGCLSCAHSKHVHTVRWPRGLGVCRFRKPQDLLSPDVSPEQTATTMFSFITGMQTTQVLGVLARLGVPDLLEPDAFTPIADIARQVGADEECLYRVMRAAANIGVFKEATGGRAFTSTPAAALLRSDHPASMRYIAAIMSMPGHYSATGELYNSVKTGEAGIKLALGSDFFTYVDAKSPEEFKMFDRAMVGLTKMTSQPAVAGHDWGQYQQVVDVGGGFGALLEALLRAHPGLTGQVFELPQVVDAAPPVPADLAGRMSYVKGNFFEAVPVASDCYAMKHILHDWSDDESVVILSHLRASLRPNGAVVLLESVMPPPGADVGDATCWKDINMMAVTTGKERTALQWEAVVGRAGFKVHQIQALPGTDLYAIVCKPVEA